jgi:hypothetical protein
MRHLTEQQLADVINATGQKARVQFGNFWKEVGKTSCLVKLKVSWPRFTWPTCSTAASVPGRPLRYVHAHLKRAYEPGSRKGPWTPAEDEDLAS